MKNILCASQTTLSARSSPATGCISRVAVGPIPDSVRGSCFSRSDILFRQPTDGLEISELFNNTDRINDQKQEFKKLGILLGESDSHPPSERASDFICKLVKEKTKAKPSSVPKNNTNKQVDTKA